MDKAAIIKEHYQKNGGILRFIPVFIPRRFSKAGKRLRLHPDDYYAYGTARGAIKERWFSSIIPAMNGEDAAPDEGMSYVALGDRPEEKLLFRDFVETLGGSCSAR